jgi:hypothetical protein
LPLSLPALSLRLSRLLVKQKSSLALFRSSRSNISNHRMSTLTNTRTWSERNASARHLFQLVSVASNYGTTPLFIAREKNIRTGQDQDATVLVTFTSESQGRDEGIHPNVVASALKQGESRPITATIWDPVQRLALQSDNREVWLCSRYLLSVKERNSNPEILDL